MAPAAKSTAARSADTGTSVRARSRHDPHDPQRRLVYKPVLGNPLDLDWPPLPASVRRAILDQLLVVLAASTTDSGKGIADWRLDEHARRRGNSRNKGEGGHGAKAKVKDGDAAEAEVQATDSSDEATNRKRNPPAEPHHHHTLTTRSHSTYSIPSLPLSSEPSEPAPPLLSHLVVGINEVTRALETRIRWGRWELGDRAAAPPASPPAAAPAPDTAQRGHRRRHKVPRAAEAGTGPAVIPAAAARAPQLPLPLANHPAYAFVRRRPPAISRDTRPPYVVAREGEGEGEGEGVRLLVNSEARRLKRLPPRGEAGTGEKGARAGPGLLVPTQPAAADDAADGDAPMQTDEPSASAPARPPAPTVPLIDLVVVCRPDINPPSLVAHLPTMVAAANGVHSALEGVLAGAGAGVGAGEVKGEGQAMEVEVEEGEGKGGAKRPEMRPVRLVQLDVGAERKLADALGLRRVAAIGLSSLSPAAAPLLSLIAAHLPTPLSAPWLVPHLLHPPAPTSSSAPSALSKGSRFAPTAVKHLKTSAPLNPRKAVSEKKDERRKGKEERRERKRRRGGGDDGEAKGQHGDGVYVAED